MELTPTDLGDTFGNRILAKRAGVKPGDPIRPLSALGRFWTDNLGLSDTQRALVLSGKGATLMPLGIGLAGFGAMAGMPLVAEGFSRGNLVEAAVGVGLAGASSFAGLIATPRKQVFKIARGPLTLSEIEALRNVQTRIPPIHEQLLSVLLGRPLSVVEIRDPLEDSFLNLVSDVIRLDLRADSSGEIIRTVGLLGEAVAALPEPGQVDATDIADLIADAETALIRARREPDSVIVESLQRQAEATVRRARALQDANKIARRTRILREEVRQQIEAVRAALPSLAASGQQTTLDTRFHSLAESVNTVAREARSVVAAHEELAAVAAPYRQASETAPQQQRLGW